MSECLTPGEVTEAFLVSPPLISQTILDLSIKVPNWLRDVATMEEWPTGAGTIMEQMIFRGAMPPIERSFDKWKKIGNLSGCSPCEGPDCSYNLSMFGGHGFERKVIELMEREFRSPSYCVAEIQTTAHFKQVFAKIVENLYKQTDFFKEMNISQNFLTMLAKKYVIDSDGPQANTQNPYVYRDAGDAILGTLGIDLLEFFYEQMRRLPDAIPYDVVDGSPIYALEASHQMIARMYRDDPTLRQDVRFSGLANDLLTKYNFMSTARGMFIMAPILYPRRFNLTGAGNTPVEVLPFVNDVPAEVGSYTYLNPAYEDASHEEVMLHGRYPFKVFHMPTETSLGGNTSFGPEVSFMNNWQWVNPQTTSDPLRRVGYFITSAKIGLSPQFSEAIYGILVSRVSKKLAWIQTPNPVCPVTPPVCENSVPAVSCPCPIVTSIVADSFTALNYIFTFASAITGSEHGRITLQFDNGSSVEGTIETLTSDNLTARISFASEVDPGVCGSIIGVACVNWEGCSATVNLVKQCADGDDNTVLFLSNAIKAVAEDSITVYYGDCTSGAVDVVSVNGLEYTVDASADVICGKGGISKVCVPTATSSDCPACGGPTQTACSDD